MIPHEHTHSKLCQAPLFCEPCSIREGGKTGRETEDQVLTGAECDDIQFLVQTRLPGDLVGSLKAIIEEYAEEIAISQDSEESDDHQVVHQLQQPHFPSEQLLKAINKTVEVRYSEGIDMWKHKLSPGGVRPCYQQKY